MAEEPLYYVTVRDQTRGPVTESQLRQAVYAGKVSLDTLACVVGDTEWRRLEEIQTFAEEFAPHGGGSSETVVSAHPSLVEQVQRVEPTPSKPPAARSSPTHPEEADWGAPDAPVPPSQGSAAEPLQSIEEAVRRSEVVEEPSAPALGRTGLTAAVPGLVAVHAPSPSAPLLVELRDIVGADRKDGSRRVLVASALISVSLLWCLVGFVIGRSSAAGGGVAESTEVAGGPVPEPEVPVPAVELAPTAVAIPAPSLAAPAPPAAPTAVALIVGTWRPENGGELETYGADGSFRMGSVTGTYAVFGEAGAEHLSTTTATGTRDWGVVRFPTEDTMLQGRLRYVRLVSEPASEAAVAAPAPPPAAPPPAPAETRETEGRYPDTPAGRCHQRCYDTVCGDTCVERCGRGSYARLEACIDRCVNRCMECSFRCSRLE